ncbi:unnamed protein product [Cochlearia groenlandica]
MTTRNLNVGGEGSPCGACKFLRRKCVRGCVFAPYFDAEQGIAKFAAVHKVFGASNASKMLLRLPLHKRLDAVVTLCYEAFARLRDPVYGSFGHLFSLQNQVMNLQEELAHVQALLSTFQQLEHNNEYLVEPSNLDVVWGEEHLLPQGGTGQGDFQEVAMQFVSTNLSTVN